MTIHVMSRSPFQKLLLGVKSKLDEIKGFFRTESGLAVSATCPFCQEKVEITELLVFGNIYEFTCPQCKTDFTVAVPPLIIERGRIEAKIKNV